MANETFVSKGKCTQSATIVLTTLSRLSVAKTKSDLSLVDKVPNAAKIKVTTVEGEGVELIEVAVVYVYRYYFIYCFVCLLIFLGGGRGGGGVTNDIAIPQGRNSQLLQGYFLVYQSYFAFPS